MRMYQVHLKAKFSLDDLELLLEEIAALHLANLLFNLHGQVYAYLSCIHKNCQIKLLVLHYELD